MRAALFVTGLAIIAFALPVAVFTVVVEGGACQGSDVTSRGATSPTPIFATCGAAWGSVAVGFGFLAWFGGGLAFFGWRARPRIDPAFDPSRRVERNTGSP